jgi:hypothetical protein
VSRFATPAELRDFLEITGTTGRKSDVNLGMMLDAASDFLERRTGRTITSHGSNTSRTFSSNGKPYLNIGDWRTIDSVTSQGTALTADSTYWAVRSSQSTDIIIGLQLRAFTGAGGFDYRRNPEWFDRNLDSWLYPGNWGGSGTLPNDVVVTGLDGWPSTPPQWKHATIALAGYYFAHADALLAGARQTPEGNVYDLSHLPVEVRELVRDWQLSEMAVIV